MESAGFTDFREFFLSNRFSDLKILCGNVTFPVHRIILCARNGYFDRLCQKGPFVHNPAGAALRGIKIDHLDPNIMRRVLCFYYCGDYAETPDGVPSVPSAVVSMDMDKLVDRLQEDIYIENDWGSLLYVDSKQSGHITIPDEIQKGPPLEEPTYMNQWKHAVAHFFDTICHRLDLTVRLYDAARYLIDYRLVFHTRAKLGGYVVWLLNLISIMITSGIIQNAGMTDDAIAEQYMLRSLDFIEGEFKKAEISIHHAVSSVLRSEYAQPIHRPVGVIDRGNAAIRQFLHETIESKCTEIVSKINREVEFNNKVATWNRLYAAVNRLHSCTIPSE